MSTKTITGTKSSAAGTPLADASDSRFMIVWEHLWRRHVYSLTKQAVEEIAGGLCWTMRRAVNLN